MKWKKGLKIKRITDEHRILVVDPGFYSLDWVLVSNGQLQRANLAVRASKRLLFLLEQAGIFYCRRARSKK
jgi:plasmid segregation protein ParM